MHERRWACLVLSLALLLGCAGCRQDPPRGRAAGKTAVTMMYPITLSHFEELVERTFTDIDLQVEPTTSAAMNGDSERRLRNGHGTDLIVTTLPTGDVKEYMMDLSATEFSTSYQATVMDPVMVEGKTRYLPLPGQYSGFILNRTLAERLADGLPTTNAELMALLDAGREQEVGVGTDGAMFGIETVDAAGIGSYIIGSQVPDFLGLMDGIQWMGDFEVGAASFGERWTGCLDDLQTCVERGYFNAETISLEERNALPVLDRMKAGTLLLCYGNARLFTRLCAESSRFEYVMLPFLSSRGNQPWTISMPDGYIGINDALGGPGREAELDACRRVLGLLSTQEGQSAWIADTGATNSYLSGYEDAENEVPAGLEECVKRGYIYDLRMPSNVIKYFGQSMIDVLSGKVEMADALARVDEYCRNGSEAVDYEQSVVGSVAEDLLYENYNTRLEETAIGNLVADAVAEFAGADIAVVNGGGIRASLYQGDVLGADLAEVCPYANTIVLVKARGSVIMEMLENGISMTRRENEVPAGRFLQVSGLHYAYRPQTADAPAQLLSVTLPDGASLDPDGWYKLAVNNYMAGSSGYLDNNGDGYTMLNLFSSDVPKAADITLLDDTDGTYADAMRAYFYHHRDEPITAKLEGRITVEKREG